MMILCEKLYLSQYLLLGNLHFLIFYLFIFFCVSMLQHYNNELLVVSEGFYFNKKIDGKRKNNKKILLQLNAALPVLAFPRKNCIKNW